MKTYHKSNELVDKHNKRDVLSFSSVVEDLYYWTCLFLPSSHRVQQQPSWRASSFVVAADQPWLSPYLHSSRSTAAASTDRQHRCPGEDG